MNKGWGSWTPGTFSYSIRFPLTWPKFEAINHLFCLAKRDGRTNTATTIAMRDPRLDRSNSARTETGFVSFFHFKVLGDETSVVAALETLSAWRSNETLILFWA